MQLVNQSECQVSRRCGGGIFIRPRTLSSLNGFKVVPLKLKRATQSADNVKVSSHFFPEMETSEENQSEKYWSNLFLICDFYLAAEMKGRKGWIIIYSCGCHRSSFRMTGCVSCREAIEWLLDPLLCYLQQLRSIRPSSPFHLPHSLPYTHTHARVHTHRITYTHGPITGAFPFHRAHMAPGLVAVLFRRVARAKTKQNPEES